MFSSLRLSYVFILVFGLVCCFVSCDCVYIFVLCIFVFKFAAFMCFHVDRNLRLIVVMYLFHVYLYTLCCSSVLYCDCLYERHQVHVLRCSESCIFLCYALSILLVLCHMFCAYSLSVRIFRRCADWICDLICMRCHLPWFYVCFCYVFTVYIILCQCTCHCYIL